MSINWDEYRDCLGFMSGKKQPTQPESNAILFSVEEMILKKKLDDWTHLNDIALSGKILKYLTIEPGLIKRPAPWSQDQESIDDYIALCAVSNRNAGSVLNYGLKHYYLWKGIEFKFQYNQDKSETKIDGWLGRFPALVAFMYWAWGSTPSLWRQIWWALSVAYSGKEGQQDPFVLNWIMVETVGKKNRLTRWASRKFWTRLRKYWPGGMTQLFETYFQDANHPIVLACKELKL